MKVLQISNYYAEFKGSFISQLEILGEEILQSGGDIIYIFPNKASNIEWCKELAKSYKVYFVNCIDRKNKKKVIKELKEIINIENPDIVHSHFDGYDIAISKSTSKDTIKIYHRHNEYDVDKLIWYKKIYALINVRLRMSYLKNKGYHVFTSNNMFDEFINKGYSLKSRSKIIMNGISTKRLEEGSTYYNKHDKVVIFSILGNWHRKGGDILFSAIEKINSDGIKVYLASIISREWIREKCGYIPEWFIDLEITDNVKKYYDMADIFVSSSRKETFSYALAEAIYCKLPCISSDIDGVQWSKEIPSVTFFLNENVDDLVKKIEKILNEKYNDDVYEKSKNYILNNYSEYRWVNNVIKFYRQLNHTKI